MSERMEQIHTAQLVKAAVDEERHKQTMLRLDGLHAMVTEKTTKLDERVSALEKADKQAAEDARKEARDEVRYWARWIVATLVTVGIFLGGVILRLKGGLGEQAYACTGLSGAGRHSRSLPPF